MERFDRDHQAIGGEAMTDDRHGDNISLQSRENQNIKININQLKKGWPVTSGLHPILTASLQRPCTGSY